LCHIKDNNSLIFELAEGQDGKNLPGGYFLPVWAGLLRDFAISSYQQGISVWNCWVYPVLSGSANHPLIRAEEY
jgi:hypothetical protein